MRARLVDRVSAELHVEPPAAFGQQAQVLGANAAMLSRAYEHFVYAFEARGVMLEDAGHRIGRLEDVAIAEDEEDAAREMMNQLQCRFEHVDER